MKIGTILVVDDEEPIRVSLRRYLGEFGYRAVAVADAEEALKAAERRRFDLGIIDMRLPGMNGDTLILRLRAMDPAMRFLIHTGSGEYELPPALRRIGLGSAHVLHKPLLDMRLLLDAIAGLEAMGGDNG